MAYDLKVVGGEIVDGEDGKVVALGNAPDKA